ncbi:phospholipase, patatin family protein, partial [Myriangium duriaei CBS 260.36]
MSANRQVNLLCIDGGGIRGLSALLIIRKLMEFIDSDNPPKPCDHFDMIGGTGTGGLIAVMLGRLEMTVDECIDQYVALHSSIIHDVGVFGIRSGYDRLALEDTVKQIMRSKDFAADTLLENPDKSGCKCSLLTLQNFVTVTSAGSTTSSVLASYYRQRGAAELLKTTTILQAIVATCAIPALGIPVAIGPSGRTFHSGETGINNPVFVTWEEAHGLFCDLKDEHLESRLNCFVSVGCGVRPLQSSGQDTSACIQTFSNMAYEADETSKRFVYSRPHLLDLGLYFRFSAVGINEIDLSTIQYKTHIMQTTDHYIDGKDVQDSMLRC